MKCRPLVSWPSFQLPHKFLTPGIIIDILENNCLFWKFSQCYGKDPHDIVTFNSYDYICIQIFSHLFCPRERIHFVFEHPFASEQNFPVVMFILLYEVLTFESLDEILQCDYSMETFLTALPHVTIYFTIFYKKEIGKLFLDLSTHTLGNPAWITELYNPLNQANELHQFEQRPFITLN